MTIKNKSWFKRLFSNSKFIALVGLFLIALIGWPLAINFKKRYYINEEVRQLNKEIAQIESDNQGLKEMIGYLNSDDYIEEQSRLNFGMKRSGEEVVVMSNFESIASASKLDYKSSDAKEGERISNPSKWYLYFFR